MKGGCILVPLVRPDLVAARHTGDRSGNLGRTEEGSFLPRSSRRSYFGLTVVSELTACMAAALCASARS
jgi:hypothetical protein